MLLLHNGFIHDDIVPAAEAKAYDVSTQQLVVACCLQPLLVDGGAVGSLKVQEVGLDGAHIANAVRSISLNLPGNTAATAAAAAAAVDVGNSLHLSSRSGSC